MKKLVLIGPGKIAKFHIDALSIFNFRLVGCISREGSKSAEHFMREYDKDKSEYFSTLDYMIKNQDSWDAVLICSPTESHIYYIDALVKFGKPILVEKPVSNNLDLLKKHLPAKNIMVAFNRRYYSTVSKFKSLIEDEADVFVQVSIPESSLSIDFENNSSDDLPISLYENSIHVFDLINYIFGLVKWESVLIKRSTKIMPMSVHGICNSSTPISLQIMFDAPENFSISAYFKNQKIELKPMEVFSHYCDFEIEEPTLLTPIRRYNPRSIDQIYTTQQMNCKPGFYEQAELFSAFCEGQENLSIPTISDSFNAIESINSISKLVRLI